MDVETQAPPPPVREIRSDPQTDPGARRVSSGRKLGRVDVHEDIHAAWDAWAELEDDCPGTIYQSRRFLVPWMATFGIFERMTPMIVVAHNSSGAPVALLPFGIYRRGPVSIAGFLGGVDSNANIGLYRPGFTFSPADLESLLRAAAAKARLKPDLFLLINQPQNFAGAKNPLDIFPHQSSASQSHCAELTSSPRDLLAARMSKESAKKLRRKHKRLSEAGSLRYFTARTPLEIAQVLDVFYQLKLARFHQKGIRSNFDMPESRSFLERACCTTNAETAAIELHALALGERMIAIYGSGAHGDHLHLLFNAFDMSEDVARYTPGDVLLMEMLERKCSEGARSFDLGIGEARYKEMWCDRTEPMFDSILALSPLGHAYRIVESTRRHAKRWIKQSRWAWPVAQRLMRRP